jgi:DNA-binding MarR family transcriptional regulator
LDPARSFGFLLKDTSRLYVQRFEQQAASLGLTLPQCRVLVHLAVNEGVSQVQLAELADVEPMTLVRILDRMESDGWLERRTDPADRRARRLYLKSKGKPLVDKIWHLVEVTRGEAFAGIPKKQTDVMIAMLEKVRINFTSLQRQTSAEPPNPGPRRAGPTGPDVERASRERKIPQS